jgi:HEAT repeat protein
MKEKIQGLLLGDEFKSDRAEILAMGPSSLPVLRELLQESPDSNQAVRILGMLPDIHGDRSAFVPLVVEYSRKAGSSTQNAAIMALGQIGGSTEAPVLEQIAEAKDQPEFARVNAVRGLARIGTPSSASVIEKLTQQSNPDQMLNSVARETLTSLRQRLRQ